VLDWLAGVTAAPELKPGWSPYLSGVSGTGKNLLVTPLEKAFGAGGARRIKPADLGAPFDEYMGARLIVVSELRETTRGALSAHDIYARIKEITDPTGGWTLVNEKYGHKHWVWSNTAMWLLTNHSNMLPVDARERRLGYYRVTVKPKTKLYYKELISWLDTGFSRFAELHPSGAPGWKLVIAWLVQRWTTGMDTARRDAFQGNAPETPEKLTMVATAANPAKELLGAIIAGDYKESTDYIPDIADLDCVRQGLKRAADTGRHGADEDTRIPGKDVLSDWLEEFKAERLNYDPATRVHTQILIDFSRRRLWAVRNAEKYRGLSAGQIADAWRRQ
jgi:hypothetical protein